MAEAKAPEEVAQDAGSVARTEVQLLRDTVEMGIDVAKDVGNKLLEVVGVKKPSRSTKRQVASVRRSKPSTTVKRVARASAKRAKKVAKSARKGARGRKRTRSKRS